MAFAYAIRASQGARRYQEDAAAVREQPDGLTAVLADGMGGHAGGAVASETATAAFLEALAASVQEPAEMRVRLAAALDDANTAVAARASLDPNLAGMGCTLVGAAFGPERLEWISVGDSPLYLVRGGNIARINEDHSLAPEIDRMAGMGRLTWEEAKAHPRRHFLRSALTGAEIDMIDWPPEPMALEAGDVVVLASDGIHTVAEAEIARLAAAPEPPDKIAEALLAAVAAADDPHQDNTTVVVVRMGGSR